MFSPGHRFSALVVIAALVLVGCTNGTGSGSFSGSEDSGDAPVVEGSALLATITRVIDGDSLEVMLDGSSEEVRLVGVNAPEGRDCGGAEATAALEALLVGTSLSGDLDDATFELIVDPDEPRDRFGRLLGTILIPGSASGFEATTIDLVGPLVADGFVVPIGGSSALFHEEALDASAAQIGVWSPDRCGPTIAGLEIESFVPNPAGPDDEPGAGEFIELRNVLETELDLTGWSVHDESTSNEFVFGGGSIGPGERFRLFSTCALGDSNPGRGADGNFYMCDSGSVWSNSGDTAFVVDPNGNVVDFRFSP